MSESTINDFFGSLSRLCHPALVVDIEALDSNLHLLASYFAHGPPNSAALQVSQMRHSRPAQLDAGSAVGITCAKLSEARSWCRRIKDVLIANQVSGAKRLNAWPL